ncbi:MAG: ribosome silencing factor [Veillonellaceae bacterium]|nr:ribosome silencing factor [Veillonellaceae bacterium]MDD6923067.1 ribosome silencing factor [Veillonellaceae bacterium]
MTPKETSLLAAKAASEKKASDIVIMEMTELTSTTDYFVISSANTATQVRAIADNVEEKLAEAGKEMLHEEGHREGEWILLDFGDVVVHVFRQDAREFYALEQLWADAKLETYED